MAALTPVVSELLCFIQNNFSSVPKSDLVSRLSGFYTAEEIVDSKNELFTVADKAKQSGLVVDLPRNVVRRTGDGKRKADAEDILDLWSRLDIAKADLPTFCAVNLSRLPPLNFSDTDLCSLSAVVFDMKSQLVDVQKKLSDVCDNVSKARVTNAPVASGVRTNPVAAGDSVRSCPPPAASAPPQAPLTSSDTVPLPAPQTVSSPARLWSDIGYGLYDAPAGADEDGYTLIQKPVRKPKPPRKILRGTKELVDGKIKTVPRRVTVFVGRLHKDTTAEELCDLLKESEIEECVCHKLPDTGKDGSKFKTAAFMVSCDIKYQDLIYKGSTWPADSELKEWIFRDKK